MANRTYRKADHGGPNWTRSLTSQSKGGHAGSYKGQGVEGRGVSHGGGKTRPAPNKKGVKGKMPIRAPYPTGQT